jgi:hypothetical protein
MCLCRNNVVTLLKTTPVLYIIATRMLKSQEEDDVLCGHIIP